MSADLLDKDLISTLRQKKVSSFLQVYSLAQWGMQAPNSTDGDTRLFPDKRNVKLIHADSVNGELICMVLTHISGKSAVQLARLIG